MKPVLIALLLVLIAFPAIAEKPAIELPLEQHREPCFLSGVEIDWDFSLGPQGFYTASCDESAASLWEYGPTSIVEGAPPSLWGTILNGNYPDDGGERLVSPYLVVAQGTCFLEIEHWLEAESGYDGCNLSVRRPGLPDLILHPIGGYPVQSISESENYYANCVDGEPGWTGHIDPHWRVDCFDLSVLIGGEYRLQFDFGSDTSVNYRGWYISRIRVGTMGSPTAACCLPQSDVCTVATEAGCAEMMGEWHPDIPSCFPDPCPPGPLLRIGSLIDPEPWHNYVGPSREPLRLEVDLPASEYPGVTEVRFFYSTNSGGSWLSAGRDLEGSEPILDTFGTSTPVGDGWGVEFDVPVIFPPPPSIRFAANIYFTGRDVIRLETEQITYDVSPPDGMKANIEETVVVSDDTLGVPIDPGGSDIQAVFVYRHLTHPYFTKGIPGINQNAHSPTSCAPASVAQCLKYFEAEGDGEITEGLSDVPLLYRLATIMRTNIDTIGTPVSNWFNGTRRWVETHGGGYTVQGFRHFTEGGYSTWTRGDWTRIRDGLQRCNDVLLGFYWQGGGGHAVTLNGISHELQGGQCPIEFRDPWTGTIQYGDIDTATGYVYHVSGAGGGGTAFVGTSMIVARREEGFALGYPGQLNGFA